MAMHDQSDLMRRHIQYVRYITAIAKNSQLPCKWETSNNINSITSIITGHPNIKSIESRFDDGKYAKHTITYHDGTTHP